MIITRKSIISGEVRHREISVTEEQLEKIEAGALIQNVCADLSSDDREFIMTGITIEEWDEILDNL